MTSSAPRTSAEPDRVEYEPEELTFFWDESKVAVVVELDDVPA